MGCGTGFASADARSGIACVGSLSEVFMMVVLWEVVRGPRRRGGAREWGEGLFEVGGVLGAVGVHRGDHEHGGLMGGQVRVVEDLLAEVHGVGAVIEGAAHVVSVGDDGLRGVVRDALAGDLGQERVIRRADGTGSAGRATAASPREPAMSAVPANSVKRCEANIGLLVDVGLFRVVSGLTSGSDSCLGGFLEAVAAQLRRISRVSATICAGHS